MMGTPIFYINVAARTDRRAFMEQQFAALGLDAERIEAVTPATVPPELAATPPATSTYAPMSLGEISCTLSHFAAWRRGVALGAPAAIVFEDDALISRGLLDLLQHLGTGLPTGIDLLKLETARLDVRLGTAVTKLGKFTSRRLTASHFGAGGYMISAPLAATLLATMPPAAMPIDDYVFSRRGRTLYSHNVHQLVPAVAVQLIYRNQQHADVARSDLAATRSDSSLPYRATRWRRLASNLAIGCRELLAFGGDVFNGRTATPFADDV